MIAKLPFGLETVAVDLRGLRVRPLCPRASPGSPCPERLVASALDNPLAGPTIDHVLAGRRSLAVVVPDATRRVALPRILPILLERADKAGIPSSRITVLVACGTHPPVDGAKLAQLVGPVPEGIRVEQHDCHDDGFLVQVGFLDSRLPVRLSRFVVEADAVIAVSMVRHHYFAGFGGGPKMIFPGLAGYEEIQENHSRVLRRADDGFERDLRCEPGVLEGNPVAEEISRLAALLPPAFSLCLTPGGDGGIAWAGAGSPEPVFQAAVEQVRESFEISEGPFPLVVAAGGGAPSDSTLIQAHKALDAACRFLEPLGEMLYVADLSEGPGSANMDPFLADPRREVILSQLRRRWVQYGHTTLRIVEKTSAHSVHLVSNLDDALAERLGFLVSGGPADVIESWRFRFPGETVGVMAGPAVYPRPDDE